MNRRFLAVCLWLLAWLAVSLAAACGWGWARGRARLRLAVTAAAGWLLAAAVLASAGADLW